MQKHGIVCTSGLLLKSLNHKNLLFLMRVGLFILTGVLLTAQMIVASPGYGQESTDRVVTLKFRSEPLAKILRSIQSQADITISYESTVIKDLQNVTVTKEKIKVAEALDLLLDAKGLQWKLIDGVIWIFPKVYSGGVEEKLKDPVVSPLLETPPITVRGRVVNEKGEPVVASIIIKGTAQGTTSNANGEFELINVANDAVLIISAANIKTVSIKVDNQRNLPVSVRMVTSDLEEVIINKGYYTEDKRLSTGNVSKVTAKDIQKQPVSNPLATLQGRVPGLEVTQQSGVPGSNFKVRIRGTNSIANGNDPLYIIDGVPYISNSLSFSETSGDILGNPNREAGGGSSPLNVLNPLDIENIEILKDADATAIYGSRGANGVILITTKKGKQGQTKTDLSYYAGVGKVSSKMNMINTRQYLDMRYEAFRNDNVDWTDPLIVANDLKIWDTTRYTDWQKELIGGTAKYMDAQVAISGGERNTQFSFGGGYHRETTVFPGDNKDQKITAHANISNTSANQKLKSSLLINFSSNFTDLPGRDLTSKALSLPANAPALYDKEGKLSWENWNYNDENPLAYLKRNYNALTNNLIANAVISYRIIKDLDARVSLGYTNTYTKATALSPLSSIDPALVPTSQNSTYFSNSNFSNWIIEPQISYKKLIGKNNFNLTFGGTFLEQITEGLAQLASGFSSEALMKNISAATTRGVATNYFSQYRYNAFFGRLNYQLSEKYIVNFTGRRDGSSRFGPGKQFANFGAIGAAWIFSEEGFLNPLSGLLSFGKLRASYGTSGNDQLGDYEYLDAYISSIVPYQNEIGLTPARLSNPLFAWERNKKTEVALDLGFFQNRISLSASYYKNRSSNQLVGYPLAPSTGFSSVRGNFPATVQNTGFEIDVNTKNIDAKYFSWSSSFNITVPKNKLVAFPNIEAFPIYVNQYVVGEPLAIRKLYFFEGINSSTGLFEYSDVNGDGSYDYQDQQSVKFVGQKFYGGLNNSFQFKNFQLGFLFQFVKQSGSEALFNLTGASANPAPKYILDRWRKTGDNTYYQRFGVSADVIRAASLYGESDRIIIDASFIRLKNLSLSYSLPNSVLSKIKMGNARIFIQGQNLLTITGYKGTDPERLNQQILPPLRVLTAGVHFTF